MEGLQALIESSLKPIHDKLNKIDKEIQDTKDALTNSVEAIAIARAAKEEADENTKKIDDVNKKITNMENKTINNTKMIDQMAGNIDAINEEIDRSRS